MGFRDGDAMGFAPAPMWHRYAVYANGKLIDMVNYPEQITPKIKYWKSRKAVITIVDRELPKGEKESV